MGIELQSCTSEDVYLQLDGKPVLILPAETTRRQVLERIG